MTRKKRIFDVEMPDDTPQAAPAASEPDAGQGARRGPMASAISENASALQARNAAAAAIRAENDELAHAFVAMKAAGQVVEAIPLDQVHTYLLTRERLGSDDPELDDLVTSIREVGLSNPIRVEARADGTGYELIQGFRRLSAYRVLAEEDPETWGRVPALVLPRGEDVAGLYRRMVDENVVRKDLSFAEMANAAQNYAADPATPVNDLQGAVKALFQSAPYSKRSYIRAFARMLDLIGDCLMYPTEIPRKLGVDLARELEDRPELVGRIRDDLRDWDMRSIHDELEVLRRHVGVDRYMDDGPVTPAPSKPVRAGLADRGKTKTTFDLRTARGRVKCTAAVGRLEIKIDRDFSTMDRARLERAIAALIDGLD
ncbi:ParB/RepB/Spo0J family partition protein [Loktanella sp. M215]|uniref:ParB/RepB/Spo0J family partition protein n=1 Tax=Loktanella sp. M215 TaxID=2675431 RepID=UPI001F2F7F31|nr:ParB N-terminal domain-containing protein [Loktanella sp. M215]MCF7702353.1 replication protein [Loktanella sp. M215]